MKDSPKGWLTTKLVAIAAIVVFVAAIGIDRFSISSTVLFGWVGFLWRSIPRISIDSSTVIAAIVGATMFTIVLHFVARSWTRMSSANRWKWRWSIAATSIIGLLFLAGLSMVGVIQFGTWIVQEPDPMHELSFFSGLTAKSKSTNNLSQLSLGLNNYELQNTRLPSSATFSKDGTPLYGWEIEFLPDYGIANVISREVPWDFPGHAHYTKTIIPGFINPTLPNAPLVDSRGFALNHYSLSNHLIRVPRSLRFEEITDGTANTILGGEINSNFQAWGKPMNVRDPALGINHSPRGFGGANTARGAQMLMANGSVRFIHENVSPEVMRALSTPAGREQIGVGALDR